MDARVDGLTDGLVGVDDDVERQFELLLCESSTLAFRVAYGVLRRREDAEEVAQEAFARAFRSFRRLRDRTRFRAWLVRMTWRLAIDRQRADRRRTARERLVAPPASESAAETADAQERAATGWRAIDALPEKLRIAVILYGIEGHNTAEVARLLKLPLGTVKSRLFLARARLKEELQCLAPTVR